jgi:hypothetical protein
LKQFLCHDAIKSAMLGSIHQSTRYKMQSSFALLFVSVFATYVPAQAPYGAANVKPVAPTPSAGYLAENIKPVVETPCTTEKAKPLAPTPAYGAANIKPVAPTPAYGAENIKPTIPTPAYGADNIKPTIPTPTAAYGAEHAKPLTPTPTPGYAADNIKPSVPLPDAYGHAAQSSFDAVYNGAETTGMSIIAAALIALAL